MILPSPFDLTEYMSHFIVGHRIGLPDSLH